MSCQDNITMAQLDRVSVIGWLLEGKESQVYKKYAEQLSIKAPMAAIPWVISAGVTSRRW